MTQEITGYIIVGVFAALIFFAVFEALNGLHYDEIYIGKRITQMFRTNQEINIKKKEKKNGTILSAFLKSDRGAQLNDKLSGALYSAGINLKAEEFMTLIVILGVLVPVALLVLQINPITVGGIAACGLSGPILYLDFKKHAMTSKFEKQLVDAVDIMCSSLKAGFSIQTAIGNIANEMPDPIAREFKYAQRETTLGVSIEDALAHMAVRVGSKDMSLLVNAIAIQKEVGGNLADVLANLSTTIRDRMKIKGNIKTLTTQGTVSGYLVGSLPIVIIIAISIMSPDYIKPMFETDMGHTLLLVAAGMEVTGFAVVKKIVTIKF